MRPVQVFSRRFFHTQSWKKTALGTEIELYSSHPLSELKTLRPIVMFGGVHGDEPEGVSLSQGLLAWLKSETESQNAPELAPWILIPCLNVDGFKKNERVNGRGVDLNRNYPSSDWSPEAAKPRYSPGPHPGSEAESQSIVELIKDFRPRLLIHFHSWQPMIVYAGEPGRTDAERLAKSSGYKVAPDIGYPTPGSLSAYGWTDNKIPVICIEEQDGLKDLSVVWPHFADGMIEILRDTSLRESQRESKGRS